FVEIGQRIVPLLSMPADATALEISLGAFGIDADRLARLGKGAGEITFADPCGAFGQERLGMLRHGELTALDRRTQVAQRLVVGSRRAGDEAGFELAQRRRLCFALGLGRGALGGAARLVLRRTALLLSLGRSVRFRICRGYASAMFLINAIAGSGGASPDQRDDRNRRAPQPDI